jgi:hypothetical protein
MIPESTNPAVVFSSVSESEETNDREMKELGEMEKFQKIRISLSTAHTEELFYKQHIPHGHSRPMYQWSIT